MSKIGYLMNDIKDDLVREILSIEDIAEKYQIPISWVLYALKEVEGRGYKLTFDMEGVGDV